MVDKEKNQDEKVEKKAPAKAVEDTKKTADKKVSEKKTSSKKVADKQKSTEKKSTNKKAEKKEVKKPKKTEVSAKGINLPISTKYAVALCKFVKNKKIEDAISDLKLVVAKRKPVPMKGEIGHKKGIMSGKFPKKASENFIKILQNLYTNANYFEIENPVIFEAVANTGSRIYGRFGVKKKRTHIKLKAKKGANKK